MIIYSCIPSSPFWILYEKNVRSLDEFNTENITYLSPAHKSCYSGKVN